MKIDEMMRDKKKEQAVTNIADTTTKQVEESDSESDGDSLGSAEDDEERAEEKKIRAMAKSL